MSIKIILENELKEAIKSRDNITKQTIRMVLSAIKLSEIDKGTLLDDIGIATLLQREIRSRRETIADAEKANRLDIVQEAKHEIQIIETYLPKQLDEEELLTLIQTTIHDLRANSPSDTGRVIKAVMAKIQGQAPGDVVSKLVRQTLNN
jgi:uncharacterized protein YqeY